MLPHALRSAGRRICMCVTQRAHVTQKAHVTQRAHVTQQAHVTQRAHARRCQQAWGPYKDGAADMGVTPVADEHKHRDAAG